MNSQAQRKKWKQRRQQGKMTEDRNRSKKKETEEGYM